MLCECFVIWEMVCEFSCLLLVEIGVYIWVLYYGLLVNLQGSCEFVVVNCGWDKIIGCYESDVQFIW